MDLAGALIVGGAKAAMLGRMLGTTFGSTVGMDALAVAKSQNESCTWPVSETKDCF